VIRRKHIAGERHSITMSRHTEHAASHTLRFASRSVQVVIYVNAHRISGY